jgi:hypothetical protein
MSDEYPNSGPTTNEAEPIYGEKAGRANGANGRKRKPDSSPLPGLDIRELVEERNWTALAGLGLIGVGILYLLQGWIGIDLNLWSLAMVGIGGWLMFDGYQKYTTAGQTWVGTSRNRLMAGAIVASIGLVSILNLSWWGLMLLAVGGWLGYDTWQKVEAAGGVWTDRARNRMGAAAVIGAIGVFGFFNLGGAWSVILIAIGAAMLWRHFGRKR